MENIVRYAFSCFNCGCEFTAPAGDEIYCPECDARIYEEGE